MDKPMTARQFALILWGPVLVGLAIWWAAGAFTSERQRVADMNVATNRAAAATDRAGRRLQQDLDELNAQTEAVPGR